MPILINKKGFYCASDTGFFNEWTRLFVLSARRHAPWAHLHVHVYDGTEQDERWCALHGVTFTQEETPQSYSNSLSEKRGYWVCHRFQKIPELYTDDTALWAIDSDSLFNRSMSESEFDEYTQQSWVNVWGEPNTRPHKTIGSAVAFSANDKGRHELSRRIQQQSKLKWFLDQKILDDLLVEGFFQPVERTFSNHVCGKNTHIWTGKGDRKYRPARGMDNYSGLAEYYRQQLANENK
jgi:hypothetical protein